MTPVSPVIPGCSLDEVVFAQNRPEYIPLPSWKSSDGMVVSRWRMTWAERLKVLFSGNLWLLQLTFNDPLQPVKLSAEPPVTDMRGTCAPV